MLESKRAAGVVTTIVAGVGSLIVLVIISLLIVSTLNGAGLFTRTSAVGSQNGSTFDESGITITACSAEVDGALTSVIVTNSTNITDIYNTANYTLANCVLTAAGSEKNGTTVNITSAFTHDSKEQASVDQSIYNYTQGIDNVSGKIPTILLIAAVIILFGAIVLLTKQSREIIGGGGL